MKANWEYELGVRGNAAQAPDCGLRTADSRLREEFPQNVRIAKSDIGQPPPLDFVVGIWSFSGACPAMAGWTLGASRKRYSPRSRRQMAHRCFSLAPSPWTGFTPNVTATRTCLKKSLCTSGHLTHWQTSPKPSCENTRSSSPTPPPAAPAVPISESFWLS